MSGFVAMLRHDGAPVDAELLHRLTAELRYRGPDGFGVWTDGPVGMGHALLHTHRSSEGDAQPRVDALAGLALVCDARIDDRVALCIRLQRAGLRVSPDAGDSELILAAYRAWGSLAFRELLGDFSVAIWDRSRGELVLGRDGFGLRCLYWAAFPGGWIVSNEIRPLLLHPQVSNAYCRKALVDFLVFTDLGVEDREQTAFAAVRKLPQGHLRTLGVDACTSQVLAWRPEPVSEVLRYRDPRDYTAHFRQVMREAVRDRIQAPTVLVLLSGGLDSTTAAAFAAELTQAGEGAGELLALTAVSGADDVEGGYAAEVARHLGIPHCPVDVSGPGSRLLETWYSTPHPGNSLFPHTHAERTACGLSRVHLNGFSADHVLCPEPSTLLESFAEQGVAASVRGYRALHRRFGMKPKLGLRSWLLGGKRPVPIWAQARFLVPDWIRPEVRTEFLLDERCLALSAREPDWTGGPRRFGVYQMRQFWCWSMVEERWPTDFPPATAPDPFLDRRVLSFLWSLPAVPWFSHKYLLRSAMEDLLPASILRRPKTPAGDRVSARLRVDALPGSWEYGDEAKSLTTVRSTPWADAPDDVGRWLPFLLDVWCKNTPDAVKGGHSELNAFFTQQTPAATKQGDHVHVQPS